MATGGDGFKLKLKEMHGLVEFLNGVSGGSGSSFTAKPHHTNPQPPYML